MNVFSIEKPHAGLFIKAVALVMMMLLILPAAMPVFAGASESASVGASDEATTYAAQNSNDGVRDFVIRLYSVCLGRDPDIVGLEAWTQRLISGEWSGAETAQGFVFSQEMADKWLSTEDYIEILYNAMMGRPSDEFGKNAWTERMKNGLTRHQTFVSFAESGEFQDICDSYGVRVGEKLKEIPMPEPTTPKPAPEVPQPAPGPEVPVLPEPVPAPAPVVPVPLPAPVPNPAPLPPSENDDMVVYVTDTGERYHLDKCRHLAASKIETTIGTAKALGYTPCGTCKPPI